MCRGCGKSHCSCLVFSFSKRKSQCAIFRAGTNISRGSSIDHEKVFFQVRCAQLILLNICSLDEQRLLEDVFRIEQIADILIDQLQIHRERDDLFCNATKLIAAGIKTRVFLEVIMFRAK